MFNAKLGVAQSKLENVLSKEEEESTAVSSILDDYAEETANMTRFQPCNKLVLPYWVKHTLFHNLFFHCWDNLTSSLSILDEVKKEYIYSFLVFSMLSMKK